MPRNKDTLFDMMKNRVDDNLHNPYKHEHGKIDRKSMLMTKLQKIAHRVLPLLNVSFFIA